MERYEKACQANMGIFIVLLITWPPILGIKGLNNCQPQGKEWQGTEGESRERKVVIKI